MTIYSCGDSVDIASIILAGGQGTRLYPLTQTRCKPDVIFGGRYRLIDIPLSASINSNINSIYVISQYLASHLNKHIQTTYNLSAYHATSIETLTPEEHADIRTWYEGTADAVRKNLEHILETKAQYYLILSGDHLYSMDLRRLLRFAITKDADLTIATIPMCRQDAKRMGIMKIDHDMMIHDFCEKPTDEKILDQFAAPVEVANGCHRTFEKECFLGSMGIYVFKRQTLVDLLHTVKEHDFGKHIIPHFVQNQGKTAAYIYKGYWEDIGTIESYYRSTMELLDQKIGLNFYDDQAPIYSERISLPNPLIKASTIAHSIVCDGCVIDRSTIEHCVVGARTLIGKECRLERTIIMGAHHYPENEKPTIGDGCHLSGVIVDENGQVGNHVTLCNSQNLDHFDSDLIAIRDGIIIVKAGAKIPNGTTLDALAA